MCIYQFYLFIFVCSKNKIHTYVYNFFAVQFSAHLNSFNDREKQNGLIIFYLSSFIITNHQAHDGRRFHRILGIFHDVGKKYKGIELKNKKIVCHLSVTTTNAT